MWGLFIKLASDVLNLAHPDDSLVDVWAWGLIVGRPAMSMVYGCVHCVERTPDGCMYGNEGIPDGGAFCIKERPDGSVRGIKEHLKGQV